MKQNPWQSIEIGNKQYLYNSKTGQCKVRIYDRNGYTQHTCSMEEFQEIVQKMKDFS